MSPVWMILCAGLGIDAGWQALPDGGYEYIIQIEPQVLESMSRENREIFSEIPPFVKNIRSYRIRIGDGELPRDMNNTEPPAGEVRPEVEETATRQNNGPAESPPPQDESSAAPAFDLERATDELISRLQQADIRQATNGQTPSTPTADSDSAQAASAQTSVPTSGPEAENVVLANATRDLAQAVREPPTKSDLPPTTIAAKPALAGQLDPPSPPQQLTSATESAWLASLRSHTWLLPGALILLLLSIAANAFLTWVTWRAGAVSHRTAWT